MVSRSAHSFDASWRYRLPQLDQNKGTRFLAVAILFTPLIIFTKWFAVIHGTFTYDDLDLLLVARTMPLMQSLLMMHGDVPLPLCRIFFSGMYALFGVNELYWNLFFLFLTLGVQLAALAIVIALGANLVVASLFFLTTISASVWNYTAVGYYSMTIYPQIGLLGLIGVLAIIRWRSGGSANYRWLALGVSAAAPFIHPSGAYVPVMVAVFVFVSQLVEPGASWLPLRMLRPDLTIGFNGMFILDAFSVFFKVVFLLAAILTILVSSRYLDVERANAGEFYALILFAVLGMMFLASAGDFITIFVSIETMALSFYILVGFLKTNRKSNEAGLKYFLLGSFSTGIFLYGISLVYGSTGTTVLGLIGMSRSKMALAGPEAPIFVLGVILVTVGLGFKIAAVPFHMWAPDAYEGAPTPVTAFLSTGSKAAAFVALARIFSMAFLPLGHRWATLLAILSVGSMTLGNVAAILQDNIKRMLAYSSIAHAGYVLLGLVAVGLPVLLTVTLELVPAFNVNVPRSTQALLLSC